MELFEDFITLDLSDYDKFGVAFPIGVFLTLLTLGIIVALFVIYFKNLYSTTLLSKLLRREAMSEESALTLAELKIDTTAIRNAITKGGRLGSMVKRVGEEKLTYEEFIALKKEKKYKEEKIDFESARFYLSAEKLPEIKTHIKYNTGTILQPIILSVVLIVIWVCLALFLDDLLYFINSSIKS